MPPPSRSSGSQNRPRMQLRPRKIPPTLGRLVLSAFIGVHRRLKLRTHAPESHVVIRIAVLEPTPVRRTHQLRIVEPAAAPQRPVFGLPRSLRIDVFLRKLNSEERV